MIDHRFNNNTDSKILISELQNEFSKSSGKAGFYLASIMSPYSDIITEYEKEVLEVTEEKEKEMYIQSFGYLIEEAARNDAEAMHLLAIYYQSGIPPVKINIHESIQWLQKSLESGFLYAANDLYSIFSDSQSEFFDPTKSQEYLDIIIRNRIKFIE